MKKKLDAPAHVMERLSLPFLIRHTYVITRSHLRSWLVHRRFVPSRGYCFFHVGGPDGIQGLRGREVRRCAGPGAGDRFEPLSKFLDETSGVEKIDLLKIDVEGAELGVLRGPSDVHWGKVKNVVLEATQSSGDLARIEELLKAKGICFCRQERRSGFRRAGRSRVLRDPRVPVGLTTPRKCGDEGFRRSYLHANCPRLRRRFSNDFGFRREPARMGKAHSGRRREFESTALFCNNVPLTTAGIFFPHTRCKS